MSYWIDRDRRAQMAITDKSMKQINKQMKRYYSASMKKILGQFEKTHNKLLSNIAEGREPTPADLYKLDTYWQMIGQTRRELQKLGEKQVALLSKEFELQFFEIYYSIAIPGEAAFNTIDAALVQQMINQVWVADGTTWSQRVWNNTERLQEALNDNLIYTVVAGKTTGELKNLLMEEFNVSYNRADALVKTELAHIQTQAARQRYEDYGITEVEVFVDEDERTCPICAKLDGKRIKVGGLMPIPAHPRCRCCIIPVVE